MRTITVLTSLLLCSIVYGQVVSTQFGQIQGHQNGSVYEFLGIPFAKPPVDSLRWKAPQDPDSWSTPLVASSFAPACPQKYSSALNVNGSTTDTIIGDEDCLYLNIWTPSLSNTANLPVLVFIHGGGNTQGSAREMASGMYLYHGKNMAARGNAVVVTIQYRLGALGFLVHGGLDEESTHGKSGNYAVLDQILALKWIKNNITNFGGDTTQTLVFGESAGGVNVGNLLTTPLASGLFTRAGIQSAGPVISPYSVGVDSGTAFVNRYIATGTNAQKIAYMRTLPADSLVKYNPQPMAGGIAGSNFGAVVDNYIFTEDPFTKFKSGNFNHVPLLIGSNADETQITAPQVVTPAMVTQLVNTYFPATYRNQILAMYPPGTTNAQARAAYIGITTDVQFTNIVRRTAQCVSANQSESVWRYFFDYTYPAPQLANLNLGAYHGMELPYVFNNWENIQYSAVLFKPQDDTVQKVMLNYWVNFAKTGNPNTGTLTPFTTWPQYSPTTDCYVTIDAAPNGTHCGLRTEKMNLWDSVIHFTPCATVVDTNISGISNAEKPSLFAVFPNPANDFIHVASDLANFDLVLFDITGRKVYEEKNNHKTAKIDCAKLNSGTYILQIGNESKRLVISH